MHRKLLRFTISVSVLVVTILVFARYFTTHPAVRHQLVDTSPNTLVAVLGLYIVFVGAVGLILRATLKLCNVELPAKETMLLTMYSSIINFFGPLQSGPAFRALYLKKKHGLKLKSFTLASLTYYAVYAAINVLFLFSGLLGWWSLIGIILGLVGLWSVRTPLLARFNVLNLRSLGYLVVVTLIQQLVMVAIFYVELQSLVPNVGLHQVIIYTGAANLALFVSLTPGAIGFRESFLVLSQHLHHLDTNVIVAANTIDRSVYVSMLLLVVVFIFGTHARKSLKV